MNTMAKQGDDHSYVTEFAERCSVAIGLVVKVLFEGLETIVGPDYSSENANLEYKETIQAIHEELIEEIRIRVQFYIDCNSKYFDSFAEATIKERLLYYDEQVQNTVAALNKTENNSEYINNIKKIKLVTRRQPSWKTKIEKFSPDSRAQFSTDSSLVTSADEEESEDEYPASQQSTPRLDEILLTDAFPIKSEPIAYDDDNKTNVAPIATDDDNDTNVGPIATDDDNETNVGPIATDDDNETNVAPTSKVKDEHKSSRMKTPQSSKKRKIVPKNMSDSDDDSSASEDAEKFHTCKKCPAKFKTVNMLNAHCVVHKIMSCDICDKTMEKRHLRGHILSHFGCENCSKSFSSQIALDKHMENSCRAKRDGVPGRFACKKCDLVFETANKLNAHGAAHKDPKCKVCGQTFKTKDELIAHKQSHFLCDQCGRSFSSSKNLKKHVRIHKENKPKPHVCQTCGVSFLTPETLAIHEQNHNGEETYVCEICNVGYHLRYLLTEHIQSSHVPKVKCPQCPMSLIKKNLARHMECMHGVQCTASEQKHFCKLCDVAFTYRNSYFMHMRKRHPETIEKKGTIYRCNKCDMQFPDPKTRNHHRETCIEKIYECDICSRSYKNKMLLDKHRNRHSNRNLICTHCGKRFVKTYALKMHVMQVHEKRRPLKCEYCFRGFLTNCSLQKHLITHTGLSDQQCKICFKCFQSPSKLNVHMEVVHLRLHKYVCDLCSKRFRSQTSLKNHILRHEDDKPYKCHLCDFKGFAWRSALKSHVEKVHGKEHAEKLMEPEYNEADAQKGHVDNDVYNVSQTHVTFEPAYAENQGTELRAEEVSAAENMEIQSVVAYDQQTAGQDVVIYETGETVDGNIVYHQQGTAQGTPGVANEDGDIQFIIYTS